jgi:hypothetical protein
VESNEGSREKEGRGERRKEEGRFTYFPQVLSLPQSRCIFAQAYSFQKVKSSRVVPEKY